MRERYRDDYWRNNDPIIEDRLLWRAQTFRHSVHLLPGQTILELGCGEGFFTRTLIRVTRGENPITATTFQGRGRLPPDITSKVEFLKPSDLSESVGERRFDYVVAMDLIDRNHALRFLRMVHGLLAPG